VRNGCWLCDLGDALLRALIRFVIFVGCCLWLLGNLLVQPPDDDDVDPPR
jgi:hypothetical protein